MICINVPESEKFDPITSEIIKVPAVSIKFEHSLNAIAQWESHFEKSFFSKEDKTNYEIYAYIRFMVVDGVNADQCYRLSEENIIAINNYIDKRSTALVFYDKPKPFNGKITSETIYYQMIVNNIPFECEFWNIYRLLALIRLCQLKNSPDKKMPQSEVMRQNHDLNEARKKILNTKG